MKINLILLFVFISCTWAQTAVMAQEQQPSLICIQPDGDDAIIESTGSANTAERKLLRVNIHYFLRSDGTGNFRPDGDGQGNPYSGYDHAREIVHRINTWTRSSEPNIPPPPDDTLGITDPNILFSLESVYFHEDDGFYQGAGSGGFSIWNQFKQNPDSVIQIFVFENRSGGYASTISQSSNVKYTVIPGRYNHYVDWVNGGNITYNTVLHPEYTTMGHEVWHLLGLSHTVRYNWSGPYPAGSPTDPDGCADTPSPYEMVNHYGTGHPACGWMNGGVYGCSNNWMDYSGGVALTPCQTEKMHYGLENGLSSYRTCSALTVNRELCDIGYPDLKNVGKQLRIGTCGGSAFLDREEEVEVYYSDFVEFGEFEADMKAKLEIAYLPACP